jgi:hypothetical protein
MRFFNKRVFLQFRPTFCRAHDPRLSADLTFYELLCTDWKINDGGDLTRYYFLYLQLRRLDEFKVPGDIAELGVFQGNTASFINRAAPGRTLR